ncbi:DNA cytosine methyltransferase [Gordonia otitidis]|uniref:DNA (cytosine-5-)-methyltransferase n=1 Tax=Gordonia otitidis (strain DSM 44809 / CCUG 52243 / JCM 12355 / NBRC 100426 / IFM 10032) TaxID=1108044 RepID=H5TS20_GORO1|nr:DNA cytosine methyltransferase [Gordonia otitidis]GAB36278.1 putative DNA methylase [Gordonia otitidis NBRC 100426]
MALTLTDLFCGAGGSSTGAIQVPGVEVRIAANHWQLAVDTHNENHQNADHACVDLHREKPSYFPKTDILWASPECTKWTVASGKSAEHIDPGLWEDPLADEANMRSRMLMFDVPRFAEYHRYRAIIVENVVDVSTRALYVGAFERWLADMRNLGYQCREVYLNAMHAQAGGLPAPQSRDRLYVVCWRDGERAPDIEKWTRPRAWCETHGWIDAMQAWKDQRKRRGRYGARAQYVYRCPRKECRNAVVEPGWLPASSIIDWELRGTKIGDRAKPLSPKTMARIRAGLERYGTGSPVLAEYYGQSGCRPVAEPLSTATTREHHGLLVPVEGREGKEACPADDPQRTLTTRSETGVLVTLRGHNAPKFTDDVLDTFAASGNHHGLLMRNNSSKGSGAEMVTPTSEVMRTVTTAGHQSLLVPSGGTWNDTAYPSSEPLRTCTTRETEAHVVTAADINDCEFRMLEPSEIKRGMAFPAEYVMLGNRREQVKMAGNAVVPPAARDLVGAVADSLGVTP